MYAEKEINIGRQIEFDCLKDLFIPMILLIHSFQIMGGTLVSAYKTTCFVCGNGSAPANAEYRDIS